MPAATLTSKGQITIPKEIREALGVKAGDRLGFHVTNDGTIIIVAKTVNLADLQGAIRPKVRGVTIDDMHSAARTAVKTRTRRR